MSNDTSLVCTCNSQLLPLVQDYTVHCILQRYTKSAGRAKLQGHLHSYNLLNGKKEKDNEIMKGKQTVCPIMLFYDNALTIVGSDTSCSSHSKYLSIGLYQLKLSALMWELVIDSNCTISNSHLDLHNAACVSYSDVVVLASISNQIEIPSSTCLVLHVFNPSKRTVDGGFWRSASVPLRQHSGINCKYQVQSCIAAADQIYCSLLLLGIGAYIYKVGLNQIRKCTKAIHKATPLYSHWLFENKNIRSFFLAAKHDDDKIFIVTFCDEASKTSVKVEQIIAELYNTSCQAELKFPTIVKAVTASVASNAAFIIYHSSQAKGCYSKKLVLKCTKKS